MGRGENVKIIFCPDCVNFLSNIFVLPFLIKKNHIDVFLFQNFTPFIFHRKVKYIAYIHDFLFFDYPQYYSIVERTVFSLMKVTSRFAREIITISKSEKCRILKYVTHEKKKIHVVYHGISDDFSFQNRSPEVINKYNLPNKYILFLGRINSRKNIQILLDALEDPPDMLPLVIVGKKDHKTFDIEEVIVKKGIDDRVFLLGHLEYRELLSVLSSAYIFIFPSFAEGFGLPPLEAMKSGVPVVVSNATCLPEVCGKAALYFSPTDKEGLILQISRLTSDDNFRSNQIQLGLKHVSGFDWTKSTAKILSILTRAD